jgi:predicted transglutaminase-like cysteine proteinase
MLPRVAAICLAASIVVWPAVAGGDTDTFWSSPSAAVLASASVVPAPVPAPVAPLADAPAPAPAAEAEAASIAAPTVPVPMQPPVVLATVKPAGQVNDNANPRVEAQAPVDGPQQTAAPDSAKPSQPTPPLAEPFGLAVTPVWFGKILTNWSGVEAGIRVDDDILHRCRDDAQHCPQSARKFLTIVAQGRAQSGRARIGIINRSINMAIEPTSDMAQSGVPNRWSSPLETLNTGRGECKDYAIVKYAALLAAGVPAQDVKLIIVRNLAANEDHAVVAVRDDGEWAILDNRWLTLVKDVEMPRVIPEFVLDESGVHEFVPPTITVAQRLASPAPTGL